MLIFFQRIPNVTRKYSEMVTKCEVYNEVGKSEETITLEVTCKYFLIPKVLVV